MSHDNSNSTFRRSCSGLSHPEVHMTPIHIMHGDRQYHALRRITLNINLYTFIKILQCSSLRCIDIQSFLYSAIIVRQLSKVKWTFRTKAPIFFHMLSIALAFNF